MSSAVGGSLGARMSSAVCGSLGAVANVTVNVSRILAISEQEFDISGHPGPQSKGGSLEAAWKTSSDNPT